ncbi:MAG TPA: DUF2892 domain-containing protein [Longimicrobiaceae bacterium]
MVRVNQAGWDRILRILVGGLLVLLAWGDPSRSWLGALAGIVGAALLVAGLVGWCPIYSALGISTRRRPRSQNAES